MTNKQVLNIQNMGFIARVQTFIFGIYTLYSFSRRLSQHLWIEYEVSLHSTVISIWNISSASNKFGLIFNFLYNSVLKSSYSGHFTDKVEFRFTF